MLLGASVQYATCLGIAFEPGFATLEFTAAPDCAGAVTFAGVLRHCLLLLPESRITLSEVLSLGSRDRMSNG